MLRSEIDFPPIPQIGELDEDFKARQKLEIDRWRAAITIIQRMREAGISCELSIDLKTATDVGRNGMIETLSGAAHDKTKSQFAFSK